MRCKTCDYRLWNLREHRCPECGSPFDLSDYEFVPNSVQFCCPHCEQPYYGTGIRGHLAPGEFDCVTCGKHIREQEMILRPADGVDDEQTEVTYMPWLQREKIGRVRAWLRTVKMALISPSELMDGVPPRTPTSPAWRFAMAMALVMGLGGMLLLPLFMLPVLLGGVRGPGGFPGGAAGVLGTVLMGLALMFVMGLAMYVLSIALWGLMTHSILRLIGRPQYGIGRTYHALCFSSGVSVVNLVPVCGAYIGFVWWLVSAILMLRQGQKVGGGRATIAVVTGPVLLIGGVVAFQIWLMSLATGVGFPGPAPMMMSGGVQAVQIAMGRYAVDHGGMRPAHPAELVSNGYLSSMEFDTAESTTMHATTPVAHTVLGALENMPSPQADAVVQRAIDALPANTAAVRLGDYIFLDPGRSWPAAPQLWTVVQVLDPSLNAPSLGSGMVTALLGDGTVQTFGLDQLGSMLTGQNQLRSQFGLPALPDPTTIRQEAPAATAPETALPVAAPEPEEDSGL